MPILNSDELFQLKFMCGNLVWIGWNRGNVNFEGGGRPPVRGGCMWPAMPIFELDRGCLDKSHVWKFGSDWLRLSRVIVRKIQMTHGRVRIRGRVRGQKFLKLDIEAPPIRELKNMWGNWACACAWVMKSPPALRARSRDSYAPIKWYIV